MSISASPIEALHGRLIHFHGLFGTVTLSLADAERAAIVLACAAERARDTTPLNMVRSKINPTISKTDPKQLLEELRLI